MMHAAHGVMLSHGEESPASLSTGEQELDAALTLEQTATTPPEIHRRPPPMMHFDGPGTSSCWETLTTQPAPVVVRPVAQHPGHEGPRKASTEDHGRPRPTAEATSPAAKALGALGVRFAASCRPCACEQSGLQLYGGEGLGD